MKQVKNFEALKKCGFVYDEVTNFYTKEITDEKSIELNDKLDWYFYGGITKDEIIELTIQMTKAGCFDEPVKTLSEQGWDLEINQNKFKKYTKVVTDNSKHIIVINDNGYSAFYHTHGSFIENGFFIHKKQLLAIMLEMEEMNNG